MICRFFPKQVDLKALHKFYDVDGDGHICYNEFVRALSDQNLSKRKTAIIEKVWMKLDPSGCGECTGQNILDALVDKEKHGSIALDFFPGTKGGKVDGKVYMDEFI